MRFRLQVIGAGLAALAVAATAAAAQSLVPPHHARASAASGPATITLPVTLRDFLYNGTTIPGPGHPDFQNQNAGLQTGLVQTQLGSDHEPVWKTNQSSLTNATDFCWWYHDSGCSGAASTNPFVSDVPDDASGNPTALTLSQTSTNVYQFDSSAYFPVDGLGWNSPSIGHPQTDQACSGIQPHNFAFTQELHTSFVYHASTSPTLSLTMDDDAWVFINNTLAIDLGGVHGATNGSVTLDQAHAAQLGLTDGSAFPIDLFMANRHTCDSTFDLTMSGFDLNLGPHVAVAGVSNGAHYPKGAVPTATCTVTSTVDGSPTVDPVLTTPSNGDGTGQQTATCSYTDSTGQSATASVTYTIDPDATQTITFTSTPPTNAMVGTPYTVTATGGDSGNPIVFITDPTSQGCGVAANGVVTFTAAGTCRIDAGQAAGAGFTAAQSVQQKITVHPAPQVVTFTSTPPDHVVVGTPYVASATGGGSGNPIVFSASKASAPVCTVDADGTVTFTAAGRCVIIATQAGNADYAKGVAQQVVVVKAK